MKQAIAVYIAAALLGLLSLVAGVYVLAGAGWALIAAGMSLLVVAGFLRQGFARG